MTQSEADIEGDGETDGGAAVAADALAGHPPAADRPARLLDVARAAGVSQGTASNVFSRPNLVRPEVRERVLAAAQAIGYTGPNPKGRLLRAGKVNAIGVTTGEPLSYFFEDPYAREFLAHLARACDHYGAGISLVSAQSVGGPAWNIQSALVDGFIVLCFDNPDQLLHLTQERQLPYVAITDRLDDAQTPAIGIDNFSAAREGARHLLALGHRRLAILGLPMIGQRVGRIDDADLAHVDYADARDRIAGYRAAGIEAGLGPVDIPVYQTLADEQSTRACLDALYAAPNPPTALLCQSDRIAFAALRWLSDRDLGVPDQVSVIGFDGVPEGASSQPPLTTLAQPYAEMTRLAARALLDPAPVPVPLRALLKAELVVRSSTAPPPASH